MLYAGAHFHKAIALQVQALQPRAALQALHDADAVLAQPELAQVCQPRQACEPLYAVRAQVKDLQRWARL